jgi:lysozyme family protein
MKNRQPPRFEALAHEYQSLWDAAEIRPERVGHVTDMARRVLSGRKRYAQIEFHTGVPWWLIGVIHAMESSCDFTSHLHNGDPLTARTVNKPAGRPVDGGDGPFSFEDSATDALLLKRLDDVTLWNVPRVCYELERYNGFGYRMWHPEVPSPYLWSATTHYTRGKYVADGSWSATAVSGQPGAVALIRTLMTLDPSIRILQAPVDPSREFVATPDTAPDAPASMATSSTGNTAVVIGSGGGTIAATEISQAAGKVAATGKPFSLGEFVLALVQSPTFLIAAFTVLGSIYIWLERARIRRKAGV